MSPAALFDDHQAEDQILTAVDELFHQRGVGSVSMSEIRDASGVSLRRLYRLYPSKPELVASWLRFRHRRWIRWFDDEIDRRVAAGSSVVDAVFDALGEWVEDTNFRGCAFLNTLAETGDLTEEHRRTIAEHKQAIGTRLADRLGSGDVSAVLVDGALVRSAALRSTAPIEAARTAAHLLTTIDLEGRA